jgi:signal transduction histidine kinase
MLVVTDLSAVALAHGSPRQKQVLVLYSARRDSQIAKVGDRELPRILEADLPQSVDYYSEFMDVPRFQDPEYSRAFRDYLVLKYKGHHFDLIVAMSPSALRFFADYHHELVGETPIVFFQTTPTFQRPANSTGIIAEPNFRGTIDLARRLQPDLQHVFVITGVGQEQESIATESMVKAQLAPLESQVTVTYFSGLAIKELEHRLGTLPEHSVVLYISVNKDVTGEYFNPLRYTDRVAAIANAPTYSWVDSTMGRGIVGGNLKVQEAETSAIAKLAVRVLRGERADTIGVSSVDLNVAQVDWRQLQRWGISASRLPAGTVMRFREPTIWDRYRGYILGAAVLVSAQSCLIALLLVQGARRRQAEAEVHGGQAKLRASYERIRDLGGRLLLAQEAERTRIARELHDDVGQQLALLAIDLELIVGTGPDLEREAGTLIDESLTRARRIAKAVHDLSHRLHPEKLHLLGLVSALGSIQRELSLPNLAVSFAHDNVPAGLPHDVTLCLFRVAQEALQNIIKHSGASQVSIRLIGTETELLLTIVDDGRGFDGETEQHTGLGLVSMRERLDAIGGLLRISTKPGAGTRLEISVPHERTMSVPA